MCYQGREIARPKFEKAPLGTTHCFNGGLWLDGTPHTTSFWEKWEDGSIYEWHGFWYLVRYQLEKSEMDNFLITRFVKDPP
jgi:hypothetical protein